MRLIAVVVLASSVAYAQPATPGAKLFDEGRELAKQNRFAEACEKFEKSYALDNGVGTELNLADCHEHLGHFALAWRLFDEAAQRSGDNPTRAKFAQGRAQALVPKLATAVIKVPDGDVQGVIVTIAGRGVKPAVEITERVDPGSVPVHVTIPGKPAYDKTLSVAAGATIVFDLGPEKTSPTTTTTTTTTAPADPPRPETPPTTERRHSRVVAAYTIGALGVVGLAAGIGIGLKAKSDYNAAIKNCPGSPPMCADPVAFAAARDAGTLADVGTVVGLVGAAAIVTGAIVFFTAPRDVVVSPIASAHSAGIGISGTF